jgi:hypothetical protein
MALVNSSIRLWGRIRRGKEALALPSTRRTRGVSRSMPMTGVGADLVVGAIEKYRKRRGVVSYMQERKYWPERRY